MPGMRAELRFAKAKLAALCAAQLSIQISPVVVVDVAEDCVAFVLGQLSRFAHMIEEA